MDAGEGTSDPQGSAGGAGLTATASIGTFNAWDHALKTAQLRKPTVSDMLAALDATIVRESGSAHAVAILNGAFDDGQMRRIASLMTAKDLLERLREGFSTFPPKVQEVIRGEAKGYGKGK